VEQVVVVMVVVVVVVVVVMWRKCVLHVSPRNSRVGLPSTPVAFSTSFRSLRKLLMSYDLWSKARK